MSAVTSSSGSTNSFNVCSVISCYSMFPITFKDLVISAIHLFCGKKGVVFGLVVIEFGNMYEDSHKSVYHFIEL